MTVVSGLALGIDAASHRGCMDAAGPAIAVLAGGPDVPYPRTNRRLYDRIRARGAIVSELPPGQRAYRWAFPARNRIMAGLAAITVVVEAASPSGSLITGVFAADLGRTVAAVPGRVTSRFSAGSNQLLADGARMVTCAQDLLDELYGVGSRGPAAPGVLGGADDAVGPRGIDGIRPAGIDGGGDGGGGDGDRGGGDGGAGRRPPPQATPHMADPVEERVLDALEAGLGIDGACAAAGLPARETRSLLARLEATGCVRRDGLGGYRRAAGRR